MNTSKQKQGNSVEDIYNRSTFKLLVDAYAEFGIHSPEFARAQLIHQEQSAKSEAEYQIRRAANQARLYEQGY